MNVRLRPTVRCSFDAEQCVLRVALKEVVKFDSWSTGHNRVPGQGQMETELVVYALKVRFALIRSNLVVYICILTLAE